LFRDDPWINEGFNDSPIDVHIDEVIEQDDEIIDKIVEKYNVDREKLIKDLNNTVYDDISAIYYLMYYDKKSKEGKNSYKSSHYDDGPPIKSDDSKSNISSRPGSSISKKNVSTVDPTLPINPQLKPIVPVSVKEPPARARRFTIDSSYRPAINDILNKPKPLKPEAFPISNNNNMTSIKEPAEEDETATTTDNGTTKIPEDGLPTSLSKRFQPTPPDKPPTNNPPVRRLRHNTISEVVPPPNIRQFANNMNNDTLKERNEDGESSNNEYDDTENNVDPTKPRSVRFTMNTNTTSSKAPDEIIRSVIMACKSLNIKHKMIGRYLIECTVTEIDNVPLAESTSFEVEVCKLPRLDNMVSFRMNRYYISLKY